MKIVICCTRNTVYSLWVLIGCWHFWGQLACSPSKPIILGIDGPQMSTSSKATWRQKRREAENSLKSELTLRNGFCCRKNSRPQALMMRKLTTGHIFINKERIFLSQGMCQHVLSAAFSNKWKPCAAGSQQPVRLSHGGVWGWPTNALNPMKTTQVKSTNQRRKKNI